MIALVLVRKNEPLLMDLIPAIEPKNAPYLPFLAANPKIDNLKNVSLKLDGFSQTNFTHKYHTIALNLIDLKLAAIKEINQI